MDFEEVLKARQAYRQKVIKLAVCGGVTFVVLMLLIFLGEIAAGTIILVLAAIVMVFGIFGTIGVFYGKKERATWRKAYKGYFVEKNLVKYFKIKHYSHTAGFSSAVLKATGMIDVGDRFNSNDYIEGSYKEVGFRQADVWIEKEYSDPEGDASYSTIFKGRWMIFEFPKKFNFRIEVVEKGFRAVKVPENVSDKGRKFERQKVESTEFNELFRIYAEDGFETFYLLDPALIHNITELGKNYKGKLLLCFVDNQLHIGMDDRKDAFEPPNVFSRLDEKVEQEKVEKDIRLVTAFVDQLKLDRKLFR